MPKVVYLHPDGRRSVAEAPAGTSVMRAAVGADIDGIAADCGGCLNCATCHVYVDEAFAGRLPLPEDDELAMLEMTVAERRPTSRLSCQLVITDAVDGLIVQLPEHQY